MSEESSHVEYNSTHSYREGLVEYDNGQLAIRITGPDGAKFDFGKIKHKYNPATNPLQAAIVSTASGNDYYIAPGRGETYVVNTRETERSGRLVAARTQARPVPLPAVEFGKPWQIPGFFTTSNVTELLLRYKKRLSGTNGSQTARIDDPFARYSALLRRHRPDVY